jgi:cobalt-zinc-cadmium efflux system outer membrane protein
MPKTFQVLIRQLLTAGVACLVSVVGTTVRGSTNTAPAALSPNSLTLRTAAELALAYNPSLAAHGFDLRAAEARRLQAGLRPNPELSVNVEDVLGTGDYREARSAQTTLQLSQVIELGGKRGARSDVAAAFRERKGNEAQLARVEVLAAVAERFVHVVGDQHEVTLAREATKLAEETLGLAERRVTAASASPIEVKRARILLSKARIAEEHAEHELLVARRQLAALWGATNAMFSEARADLFTRSTVPDFEELAARIDQSPELARWASERAVREAEVKLAAARRRPDLTAGAGVRHYNGPDDVGFVFQFSLPLPLGDRQQGARAEARALADKTEVERAGAELRLRTTLFGIAQELIHADTELIALEREMIPDAEAALQLAREGFERARFSQLELLDAQRTLLELRLQRIEAAAAYHQFVIEIEKLLGEPLSPGSAQSTQNSQP